LRDFIAQTLDEAPVAFAPGIFVVFRDKELEQEILLKRRSRTFVRVVGIRPPARERREAPPRPELADRVRAELELLWTAISERGRVLDVEEFPDGLRERLRAAKVSPARATECCLSDSFNRDQLATTAATRREDLLVHLAPTLFPGAPRYTTLPRSRIAAYTRRANAAVLGIWSKHCDRCVGRLGASPHPSGRNQGDGCPGCPYSLFAVQGLLL
jgi:hypothetical protein